MAAKDSARESIPLGQTDGDPERLRRNRLTLGEIVGQPQAIDETLREERSNIRTAARVLGGRKIKHVYLVGCGDSLAVMVGMRGILEHLLRVPCEPVQALEYAYYHQLSDPDSLVIALTSTGWTTKVAESVARARKAGMATVAVSNSADAPIFSIAEVSLLAHATRSGWPTQSSTTAMAVIAQLGIELAISMGTSKAAVDGVQESLNHSASQVAQLLHLSWKPVAELAAAELPTRLFLFSGGGPSFATAMIGAAKIKECTNRHAVAIQIEEYHHYLSQMVGEPMFMTVPNGPSVGRSANAIRVGRANGGRLYGLVPADSALSGREFDWSLALPPMNELLTPIVYTVPLQVFAYDLGMMIGGAGTEVRESHSSGASDPSFRSDVPKP